MNLLQKSRHSLFPFEIDGFFIPFAISLISILSTSTIIHANATATTTKQIATIQHHFLFYASCMSIVLETT